MLGGEGERVDAAEVAIGRLAHRALDRGNTLGVGRLPQHAEKASGSLTDQSAHADRTPDLGIGRRGNKARRRRRASRGSQAIDRSDSPGWVLCGSRRSRLGDEGY
jgi:hypothetical protein